jgi:putative ABC transport system permease protein
MFKNFFNTAWRTLWKNKSFSFITISALALSMAGAILLLLWIQRATSMDRFHAKGKSLFKVYQNTSSEGNIDTKETIRSIWAQGLTDHCPGIVNSCRVSAGSRLLTISGKRLHAAGAMVDPVYLKLFSFPLLAGSANNALSGYASIVITEKLARNLFNSPAPINEVILVDGKNYKVTGILKNLPENTQLKFDFLLPWDELVFIGANMATPNEIELYVEGNDQFNISNVNRQLKELLSAYNSETTKIELFLYPFERVWLYGDFWNGKPAGGLISVVHILELIIFLLLVIGSINFINLSTARSERRAKEIGIRKITGASRTNLVFQFLTESIVLSFIAAVAGLLLAERLLPSFNLLVQQHLSINYWSPYFMIAAVLFVSLIGIAAGLYPAIYLSSLGVLSVMKTNKTVRYTKLGFRKILVVLQFVVAIVMINYSYAIFRQAEFVKQRETGFAIDALVFHQMNSDLSTNYTALRQHLLNEADVKFVNRSGSLISQGGQGINGVKLNGQALSGDFEMMTVDMDFVSTNELKLMSGRDLDMLKFSGDSNSCLVNVAAVTALGIKNPIGQMILADSVPCKIVGVVADYINGSPFQTAIPLIVKGYKGGRFLNIRLRHYPTKGSLRALNEIIQKYNPNDITELQFVATDYAKKLQGIKTSLGLVAGFAISAIFISFLGVFGLCAFMAEGRKKEIGIRKVLGATMASIVYLLSRRFMQLILLSIFIASPIAWFWMSSTLSNFYYRVDLGWWILAGTAVFAVVIALGTVSFVGIKAVSVASVKSLKQE